MGPGTPGYVIVSIITTLLLIALIVFIARAVKEMIIDELKAIMAPDDQPEVATVQKVASVSQLPSFPDLDYASLDKAA